MKIAWIPFVLILLTPLASRAADRTPVQLPPTAGFIPNQGQAPAEVVLYSAVPGGALYLTRDALIVETSKTERVSPTHSTPPTADDPIIRSRGHAVWVRFSDANPHPAIEVEGPGQSSLHFLMGNDPAAWHADVPMYERATYRELWPGIDLTFARTPNGITCALSGATPDTKRARFERHAGDGTQPAEIDISELSTLLTNGTERTLDNPGALVWSSFLGGSAEEIGWGVDVDSGGNPVVTGLNTSRFFPTTPGAFDQVYTGIGDVFVSKLSADGTTLVWSTFIGGTALETEQGYAVAVDASDNVFVTGFTRSEDFPVTVGSHDFLYNGAADVFVTKLNSTGSTVLWSTYMGGSDHDIAYDIDLDASGDPVVAGRTLSEGFPTTAGSYDITPNGEEDAFIAKFNATGELLLWSTLLGGSGYEDVHGVEFDGSDAPLVCGYTASLDFPGGSANGLYDIFVAKLSPLGTTLTWSALLGGSAHDYGTDLALDSAGNPVICGSTGSSDFPVTSGASRRRL